MSNVVTMASRIEIWPVDRLVRYERNVRTHSGDQIAKIAASITEFGFVAPILVDEKSETIIAGHGRLSAAEMLSLSDVPVIPLGHLNDAQRRAYIIADNRLALDAGWDYELLTEELNALQDNDFDLALTGFNDDELAKLLADELPEEPEPDENKERKPVHQIKLEVSSFDYAQAREIITNALDQAGLSYEEL